MSQQQGRMSQDAIDSSRTRMIIDNPMSYPDSRQKMLDRVQEIRHCPVVRGGCGKPIPAPQQLLADAIFARLKTAVQLNYAVRTAGHSAIIDPSESKIPTYYNLDIAIPMLKLGIEVDGTKHRAFAQRAINERKAAVLGSLGWVVMRFTNQEADERLHYCVNLISRRIATLAISEK